MGVGCQRLGLYERPTKLCQKQVMAAIGQVHLMRNYEDTFNALGLVSAAALVDPVHFHQQCSAPQQLL